MNLKVNDSAHSQLEVSATDSSWQKRQAAITARDDRQLRAYWVLSLSNGTPSSLRRIGLEAEYGDWSS